MTVITRAKRNVVAACAALGLCAASSWAADDTTPSLPVVAGAWVSQGPGPATNGQVEGTVNTAPMPTRPVSGAIQTVVAHPTDANTLWVGAVGGGVWKTTNALAASPTWTPLTDGSGSLAIGAMDRDPTDATHNTLVAGIGQVTSFAVANGARIGILRTTNGGTSWTHLGSSTLAGRNISGVAPRGATIVVSVNLADSFTCSNIGIWRSTDTGGTFTRISATAGAGTGLPLGRAFDLASDPTNNAILYTGIRDTAGCNATSNTNGVYKSADTGATWTKVSDAVMDAMLATDSTVSNIRMAVGQSGEVYAGLVVSGRLAGLFRSGNGGMSWTQLDTPQTNEGGTLLGIHVGGQGATHFSIRADPTNANIVYVGGDRQPLPGDATAGFPNSIGARDYTGRLFRVDASLPSNSQATALTHDPSTSGRSAPHADSRRMVFDAAGNLIEVDDGGIYRRTNPRTTGDWFSVIGDLRVTEMHDVAWDRVSGMAISGNQDTGTTEQTTVGGTTWSSVHTGDGGDVSVDDTSSPTESRRYTSFQFLSSFRRRIVNASGVTTSTVFPVRTVTGGPAFVAQFVTPVEVNTIDPARILFAGSNDLYESFDRGDTITALGFGFTGFSMAYGGTSSGSPNAAVIYALRSGSAIVYVRTAGSGAPVATATDPGTSSLRDVAVDPTDWQKAYVVNGADQVWATGNAGATWTNVTGDLTSGTSALRTIVFVPGSPAAIVVGGQPCVSPCTPGGPVYRMSVDAPGTWNQLGTGLPNSTAWDMDYDPVDDVLIVGTLGRGAWKLSLNTPLPTLSIDDVTVTEGNAGTVNATFTVTLSSAANVTVSYATANSTATAPSDYASVSGTVSFTAAGPTAETVTVTVNGDVVDEADETFFVNLSSPSGATILDGQGQGTITDDDQTAVSVSDASVIEGFSGSTTAAFTISLSTPSSQTVTVPYSTANDTATTSGSDYVAAAGSLVFLPGEVSQQVPVTVNGDTTVEPTETFFVNLGVPTNATVADGQGVGTIINDDPPTPSSLAEFVMLGQIRQVSFSTLDTARWFKVRLVPGRSYAASAWAPSTDASEGTVALDVAWFLDDGATAPTDAITSVLEPVPQATGHTGAAASIIPSAAQCVAATGCTYRVRVQAASPPIVLPVNLMIVETTMVSPYWAVATAAGYDAAPQVRNNTSSAISVTFTAYGNSGSTVCSNTFTVPANGMTTFGVSGAAPGCSISSGFGSAVLAHHGPPGSITANITTFSAVSGLSFDAPFRPRNTWTSLRTQ